MDGQFKKLMRLLDRLGTSFKLVPDLYELSLSRIDMEAVEGIPLIAIKEASLNSMQRIVMKVVDVTLSTLVLLIGLPLWLCIALAIRLTSSVAGSPRCGAWSPRPSTRRRDIWPAPD